MSEYSDVSESLKKVSDKNIELQSKIQDRTEEFLSFFWKLKPMLKNVENIELTPKITAAWIKSRLAK